MAAPNIRNPSSIVGKTVSSTITNSNTLNTILSNSSGSDKVFKINSIFAANIDGSALSSVSIALVLSGTTTYIAYTIEVPADSTQIISTKETYFYLEENCSIQASATSASDITVTISYEELS